MNDTANFQSASQIGYSPENAAKVSGVCRTNIFAAIKEKRLRARKFGRRTIILADDLKVFLESLPEREVA